MILKLNIVTPGGLVLSDEALSLSLPGKQGNMQILPGHQAILSELISGVLRVVKKTGELFDLEIKEGFLVVDKNQVDVLCEKATE